MNQRLSALDSEAVEIIREGIAAAVRPVMRYSIGKDSSVLLHLVRKAFWPAPLPMPLLHVDTTWKFREMIAFRDRVAAEAGVDLVVHTNQDGVRAGVTPFTHGSEYYTEVMKTVALRQALDAGRYDMIFTGARRDEEKSRAKERVFSLRGATHQWDPRAQRPELRSLYNTRLSRGESLRVSPLSNWTEADIWRYIAEDAIPLVRLYYAAERLVVTEEEGGLLLMPPTLRFVLCGSVDDGKSTVIGRLLYDCKQVFADQMGKVEADSRRYGSQGDAADLALLVDGLRDEREQGITIDVAYRAFETPRRRFMVADAPGHEQYTRNMATGASTADLAVVVVDARKGILPQTARHTRIAAMFGVQHMVLAVNKMDLAGWERETFDAIVSECRTVADEIGVPDVRAIPVSALTGDNLTRPSEMTPWYDGPTLLGHLETVEVAEPAARHPFRMPVQYVNRPNPDFRGYCGRVASGTVSPGDLVSILPSGVETEVESIVVWQGTREHATRGDSVTLTLAPDVDASRGDVIVDAEDPLEVADQFQARIVWMSDEPLRVGRPYQLKLHTREVGATVTRIRHRMDVSTGGKMAAERLELNDLGVVNLATSRPVPFAAFDQCRELGGFILIDRATNATAGAGTITFALMRAGQPQVAGLRHHRRCARQAQAAARAVPVADRPVRIGQVHGREPAGQAPVHRGAPHLSAGRRQPSPRPQPRPRLHRCRPRGEHPQSGRGGTPDGGRGIDRSRGFHQSVSRRARFRP